MSTGGLGLRGVGLAVGMCAGGMRCSSPDPPVRVPRRRMVKNRSTRKRLFGIRRLRSTGFKAEYWENDHVPGEARQRWVAMGATGRLPRQKPLLIFAFPGQSAGRGLPRNFGLNRTGKVGFAMRMSTRPVGSCAAE